MPTLFTDPRSGGVKKSSGVNVLPDVAETWASVRNNADGTSYLLASYARNSKTDIHIIQKGPGGIQCCCQEGNLPENQPLFGGVRLESGRFVSFVYSGEGVGVMQKGRASMHKNGVLNVLEGCDAEIEVWTGMREEDVGKSKDDTSIKRSHVSDKPTSNVNPTNALDMEESRPGNKKVDINHPNDSILEPSTSESEIVSLKSINENTIASSPGSVAYAKLKDMLDPVQYGIDPSQKELALSDSEFIDVFKMDKASFAKLAGWKKTRMKKDASLF